MLPYDDSTVTSPSTEVEQVVYPSDQGTVYLTVLIDTYDKAHRDLHWKLRYIFQECPFDIKAFSERYFLLVIALDNRCGVAP